MTNGTNPPAFTVRYVNLASETLGARALSTSDDFFAAKERMLQDTDPVFYPDKYDENGKWMDGWESRRRRHGGHDHCVVRLAHAGRIHGVEVDTSFFTGNYPPGFSLEGALCGDREPGDGDWKPIVEETAIAGDSKNYVPVDNDGIFDTICLHIYPDGGVARLRVYGQSVWDIAAAEPGVEYELSAIKNGGRVIGYSDSHYGPAWPIFVPGRGVNMGDGWETRRRRDGGTDWLVAALGHPGRVTRIEVDTAHFKGNYPDRCSIQAALAVGKSDEAALAEAEGWPMLLPEQKLEMDRQHFYAEEIERDIGPVSHIRFNNIPDGGISRLRIFGTVDVDE
jgi:allantoicase